MKRILIVKQAFAGYARGAVVDDPQEIARLLASEHADKLRETQLPTREEAAQQDRERVLEAVRGLALADAVFAVETFNRGRRAPVAIDIFELFAATPRTEIQDWQRRVVKLLREAYDVGDAFLSKDAPYEAIKERFLRDNPGFGQDTYADAEDHGRMAAFH